MIILYIILGWATTLTIGIMVAFLSTRQVDKEFDLPPTRLVDFLEDMWVYFRQDLGYNVSRPADKEKR